MGWIFSFFSSFLLAIVLTPVIIKVAKMKHLVDEPKEDRKIHFRSIPSVGGIGIFASFLFSISFWSGWDNNTMTIEDHQLYQYFIAGLLVLFFVGLKDDLTGMSPFKKLFALTLVGLIMVFLAPMRITTMGGLFGIYQLPTSMGLFLSLFTYIVVINAINLIDGIDGLASGVCALAALLFGLWFFMVGNTFFAIIGCALAGSLVGFLVFNHSPAKIFMGDGGSLVVGFILCVLAVKMINYPAHLIPTSLSHLPTAVLVMTILSYPLFDTIRVFFLRSFAGRSPFSADKNHIHHRLIGNGFGHRKASYLVYIYSVLMVAIMYFIPAQPPTTLFVIMLIIGATLVTLLIWIKPLRKF